MNVVVQEWGSWVLASKWIVPPSLLTPSASSFPPVLTNVSVRFKDVVAKGPKEYKEYSKCLDYYT